MNAGLKTFQAELWPERPDVRNTHLNPQLRYMLLESGKQEALVVWVGDEPHPLGTASVWVSADGVVIRTVKGQLVGMTEPARSWRLPLGEALANEQGPNSAAGQRCLTAQWCVRWQAWPPSSS